MDTIRDFLYLLYVIHQNAITTLSHFVITNVTFIILLAAILYVFNVQNKFVERTTLRPLRRTMSHYPYGPKPAQVGGLAEDIVQNELSGERLRLLKLYAAIIATILLCFFMATKIVLYMLTIMWVVGVVSIHEMKGDQEEMANTIQKYSLGYCLILMLLKLMINFVVATPASDWSRALGVALPQTAAATISGYLPTMFMILTVGIPIMYFRVVAQRWSIAHKNEDANKRRDEIMRTSNQNMLSDAEQQDLAFRNQNRLW